MTIGWRIPLLLTLRRNWREVVIAILAKFIETATFFLFATFTVSYAVILGYSREEALNAVLIAAVLGTFFAESFPADVRYTGASLGYQVGAAIAGGPVPLIAMAIVAGANNYAGIGVLIGACALLSVVAVLFAKDRTGQPLDD